MLQSVTRIYNLKRKHKDLVDGLEKSGNARPAECDTAWFKKMEWIHGRDPAVRPAAILDTHDASGSAPDAHCNKH